MIVGVIGAGQLARMMIPAAINLGLDLRVFAEAPGMSAQLAAVTVGDYRDPDAVLQFAKTVDAVTFDHEHVPQAVLQHLVAAGIRVHPGPDALGIAQDKIVMRQRLTELGIPVPVWSTAENAHQLGEFLDANGGAAVVKAARGGYDGKGVRVVRAAHDADDWFAVLAEDANGGALLVEELVDFRRELAQSVARRPSGELAVWPLVESVQRDGVCAEVFAPAPDTAPEVSESADEIARALAVGLNVTGVLAVELFETRDGRVLVNELAMRPHNSGHWSIEGSVTSQFEQHLRAVLDLPLGDTGCLQPWSVMVNVLGAEGSPLMAERYGSVLAQHPNAKVHNYGKEPRPGRKLGHVTVTGEHFEAVVQQARDAADGFARPA